MKTTFSLIFALFILISSSCKKDRTCMCSDPRIDNAGFVIHDTKAKARRACHDTQNPYNSSQCELVEEHGFFK